MKFINLVIGTFLSLVTCSLADADGGYTFAIMDVAQRPPITNIVRSEEHNINDEPTTRKELLRVVRHGRIEIPGCDEEYYRGVYNPQAALAYCEGHNQCKSTTHQTHVTDLVNR